MLKNGLLIGLMVGLIFSGAHSKASMECTGVTLDKSYVTVQISTQGPKAELLPGAVNVVDANGNRYGYRIEVGEVVQYFEQDLIRNSAAFVGLKAYILGDNPLELFYQGDNYADQDLKLILNDPNREKTTSGSFKIWRGPGYPSTQQFEILDFVCGVWADQ